MQKIIAQLSRTARDTPPKTPDGWKRLAGATRINAAPNVEAMRQRLDVHVESGTMSGAKIYTVTPKKIRPENAHRTLVQIHGGTALQSPGP